MTQSAKEERQRRRDRLKSAEPGITVRPGTNVFLFYAICSGSAVAVALAYFILQPNGMPEVGVAAAIASVVAPLPLQFMLVNRWRARSLLRRVGKAVGRDLAGQGHPVRYGLNAGQSTFSPWDDGPQRTGVLIVTSEGIRLFGTDSTTLDLPLNGVLGAVLLPGRSPVSSSVIDVHLCSGEAIEIGTTQLKELGIALSGAGVRLLQDV
ncbi:hypothetical protein [Streptomyces sp. NPDC051776]|uniref:hypothetical protein n=1 Tax=Streptomyces sp. NPDC051776 TaxID=3155414 RepID=UPI0034386CD0